MILFVWIIVLGVLLMVYIIYPLYREEGAFPEVDATQARMQTLNLEREQSYSALADLDEDYESGKLSERDYRELRAALMQETAQIISQLETDAKTDVETEIEKYKRQKRG